MNTIIVQLICVIVSDETVLVSISGDDNCERGILIMPRENGRGHLLPDSMVYTVLRVSRSTFYRLLEKGVITSPVAKIGKNRRGWTLADIGLAKQEIESVKETR